MSLFEINEVIVTARLTRDPELRSLPSGMSIGNMRIAVNESVKDKQTGEYTNRGNFFDVVMWDKLAERICREGSKGDRILVEGKLRWREWEHEGQKRQAVEIVANKVLLMGDRPRDGQQSQAAPQAAPAGAPWAGPAGFAGSDVDDDIPF